MKNLLLVERFPNLTYDFSLSSSSAAYKGTRYSLIIRFRDWKFLIRNILFNSSFHKPRAINLKFSFLYLLAIPPALFRSSYIFLLNSFKEKIPLKTIGSIYIEDQFISYCIRYSSSDKQNKFVYAPSNRDYFQAIFDFLFTYTYADLLSRVVPVKTTKIFISHEIYEYSAFVRLLSHRGIESVIPLKLPYSYTIPAFYKYGRYILPPFLAHLNQSLDRTSGLNDLQEKAASDYLYSRTKIDNKELFYLRHSSYSSNSNIHPKLYKVIGSGKPLFVVYLHKFSDDQHRYGIDEFDTVWDWTVFTLNTLIDIGVDHIFVKIHPNTDLNSHHLVHRYEAEAVEILKKKFHGVNVNFLPKDHSNAPIMSYSKSVIISHHGSVVPEAFFLGKKVICSRMSPWSSLQGIDFWNTASEYKECLKNIFYCFPGKDKSLLASSCTQQSLRKLIYYYHFNSKGLLYELYTFYIFKFFKSRDLIGSSPQAFSDSNLQLPLGDVMYKLIAQNDSDVLEELSAYLASEFSASRYYSNNY